VWGWSVGFNAGLLLLTLARVVCWLYFYRYYPGYFSLALGRGFGRGTDAVVGVSAGLLLHT
jgi:hypothetical protein